MTLDTYSSEVVQQAAFKVVGLKIRTTMATAGVDCPQIWQDFGPRMAEIITGSVSFGVCVMIDEHSFDYWATLPYNQDDPVPLGMAVLEVPDGPYARCDIKGLDELAAAYMHMFQIWSSNSEYGLRCEAPSFELYPKDFNGDCTENCLSLYMPLRKLEK